LENTTIAAVLNVIRIVLAGSSLGPVIIAIVLAREAKQKNKRPNPGDDPYVRESWATFWVFIAWLMVALSIIMGEIIGKIQ